MPDLINYALRLGLICSLSGGLLSWVHSRTEPIKLEREASKKEAAKEEVFPLPDGTRFKEIDLGERP